MILDTIRIYLDEDTRVEEQRRLVMPYSQMNGPFEDVSHLWDKHEHVTSFQDDFGEKYHVLEPMQKIIDGWMYYMEQTGFNPIQFSAQ